MGFLFSSTSRQAKDATLNNLDLLENITPGSNPKPFNLRNVLLEGRKHNVSKISFTFSLLQIQTYLANYFPNHFILRYHEHKNDEQIISNFITGV